MKSAQTTVSRMIKTQVGGKEALTFENREQTYVKTDGYILVITYTTNDPTGLFDQIFSTFKFLDQNQ